MVGDPAVIWALVTDIDLPARFSGELQSVEWLDGATAVEVGNRFRGTTRTRRWASGRPSAPWSRSSPGVAGHGA